MIDRSEALNLARDWQTRPQGPLNRSGISCLAAAVLAMDEYIRSQETDQRDRTMFPGFYLVPEVEHDALQLDATRYRWLRAHDMTFEYCEWVDGILNDRQGFDLDAAIDAAMASQPISEGQS